MWTMPDAEFIRFATQELVTIGILEEGSVLDSTCLHVKKAYPAYFGTYAQMDEVRKALDSIPNLYCIGRNGQHRYNNMDHSMMTALEASRLFRNHASSRETLWNVNTEKEYHEQA